MTTESAINQQSTSRKKGQFVLALVVGAALALLSWQLGVLDGSTDVFSGVAGSAASSGGPGTVAAIAAALVIGATMIVLPCGFPAVFAMPSILTSRKGLPQRTSLSLVFLAASALPLAALGVGLGFAGDAILGLLDSMSAKMGFAVVLYSGMGIVAIGYALSQVGLIHLPSRTGRLTGPNMPGQDKPYRRSLVLGSTMGAGMGMGCLCRHTTSCWAGWRLPRTHCTAPSCWESTAWAACCRPWPSAPL